MQRQYLAQGLVKGDPDEVVQYEFVHPEVTRVYEVIDRFYWDEQLRLDELKKKIHFLQVALHDRKDREGLRRLAHGLVYIVVPVNSLPLKLFEAVLRAGRSSGHASAEVARAARALEARGVRL